MRAIFIRHGESTANVGVPSDDHTRIALTDQGHTQAAALAEGWSERPGLIALSPYLRTHLTAAPTRMRFPDVPVEVLPMQEFTYLEPSRWNGTSHDQRISYIDAYWSAADPSYCDGPGAESFSALLRRVENTLATLERLDLDRPAFAFSHGQFMQAMRVSLQLPGSSDKEKMQSLWKACNDNPIMNAEMIEIATQNHGHWDHGHWAIQKTVRAAGHRNRA